MQRPPSGTLACDHLSLLNTPHDPGRVIVLTRSSSQVPAQPSVLVSFFSQTLRPPPASFLEVSLSSTSSRPPPRLARYSLMQSSLPVLVTLFLYTSPLIPGLQACTCTPTPPPQRLAPRGVSCLVRHRGPPCLSRTPPHGLRPVGNHRASRPLNETRIFPLGWQNWRTVQPVASWTARLPSPLRLQEPVQTSPPQGLPVDLPLTALFRHSLHALLRFAFLRSRWHRAVTYQVLRRCCGVEITRGLAVAQRGLLALPSAQPCPGRRDGAREPEWQTACHGHGGHSRDRVRPQAFSSLFCLEE